MRDCLLECVENELRNKSAAKKPRALAVLKLKLKSIAKRCEICDSHPFYCEHESCCYPYHRNTAFNYCPDCGAYLYRS